MSEIITVNMSPFNKYRNKIIPTLDTELDLVKGFKYPGYGETIEAYIDKYEHEHEFRYDRLLLTYKLINRFMFAMIPVTNSALIGINVIKMEDMMVTLECVFES